MTAGISDIEERCSACDHERTVDELLRVWSRSKPWQWRFVCRPDGGGWCFRQVVRIGSLDGIAPATDPPPVAPSLTSHGGPTWAGGEVAATSSR